MEYTSENLRKPTKT